MNSSELIQLHFGVEARVLSNFSMYGVTSTGDVYTCVSRTQPPRLLRPGRSGRYLQLILVGDDEKHYNIKVHRLVALAWLFVPRKKGLEVCHNDGDRRNNQVSNLRWDTHANNQKDMIRKDMIRHGPNRGGVPCRGEASPWSKLTAAQVREIRELYATGVCSQRALGMEFHCRSTTIGAIVTGRSWKHLL